jgi:DNA polymerase-3 subunit delta'
MAAGSPETICEELRRARSRGQVHGGYLFEGARGTGKRESALWFARLLLCRADDDDPCGSCPDCRKLSTEPEGSAEGTEGAGAHPHHPDLKWVEPDGAFIRVDQIRELQRELSLVANEGGRRVALILGAERLRTEASNALLKTLEEPPPRTTLLLVAESSEALLPTLRSRTVRLRLAPVPEAELQAALESEGFSAEDAWLACAVGGGSPAAARDWAEGSLDAAREMRELIEDIESRGATQILDFAQSFRGGEAARTRAELLMAVLRAIARREVQAHASAGDPDGAERWLDHFEAVGRTRGEFVRRNLNPQLVVEGLLLDLRASGATLRNP